MDFGGYESEFVKRREYENQAYYASHAYEAELDDYDDDPYALIAPIVPGTSGVPNPAGGPSPKSQSNPIGDFFKNIIGAPGPITLGELESFGLIPKHGGGGGGGSSGGGGGSSGGGGGDLWSSPGWKGFTNALSDLQTKAGNFFTDFARGGQTTIKESTWPVLIVGGVVVIVLLGGRGLGGGGGGRRGKGFFKL